MPPETSEQRSPSEHRVLPLLSDPGNRQLLEGWIDEHPSYAYVAAPADIEEADFDICIIDKRAFEEHLDALRARKTAAAPVLLPYLLLLPESEGGIIESDAGQLADNVVTETIDEIVSLPIQQAELNWRLEALIRLREQSLTLRSRERELERQVDLFEKAQEIADVGAWEYDIEADEAWWTDKVYRIHGLPEDTDPSPAVSFQYYHPEDRVLIEEAFQAAVEEGEPYDLELRLSAADDTQRWVRTQGEPQYADGTLTRVRGTIQDITDSKERQRRLRRIERAVESSGHAFYITDSEGTIEYVNPAFERITGYAAEEAVGSTPRILKSGELSEAYYANLWDTIRGGDLWEERVINQRKDGELYYAYQTIAPVLGDNGELDAFVAIQTDITERKRLEVELEETIRHLQVIDRVLRHNLHNDMNVIQGYAEKIYSDAEDSMSEDAQTIIATSERLLDTVDKERDITKLLSEEQSTRRIDLSETFDALLENVRDHYPAATFTVSAPDDVTVHAVDSVSQAFEELLTNAVTHSDRDAPTIAIDVSRREDTIEIRIADDGPGIPDMEYRIFDEDADIEPLVHASGLGLWLVYLIVRASDGAVRFEENAPRGSVIVIELPAGPPAESTRVRGP